MLLEVVINIWSMPQAQSYIPLDMAMNFVAKNYRFCLHRLAKQKSLLISVFLLLFACIILQTSNFQVDLVVFCYYS